MQGHVTILGFTPNIEAMIASGGRISTMDGTADEIFETSLAARTREKRKAHREGAFVGAHVGAGARIREPRV